MYQKITQIRQRIWKQLYRNYISELLPRNKRCYSALLLATRKTNSSKCKFLGWFSKICANKDC
ncbi:hypothetical protein MSG28_014978 [Choristoneura fumiferana]|uniref:Uncharacterized protein n=1 Tax=Choristoneura fumiferana TaxID=7141 RepID=A0ACC0KZ26_CHOFU|nr:hypothetical protein MSG28_014978 [Choristoneura fumiferana]